jgi:hypothetical protein
MSDWLKIFGEMSLDNLFVIAGLAFLAVGVIGKISGRIDPSSRVWAISAMVGVCLILGGVWIHHGHITQAAAGPPPNFPLSPIKEAAAQDARARQSAEDRPASDKHRNVRLSYFEGTWKNTDANTRGLTTLSVRTAGESVWVHAWGACHPSDCDWGEVSGASFAAGVSSEPAGDAQKVTAVFETSFSNTLLTLSPADDDTLEADTRTRFTDDSRRSSYSATYTFRH